MQDYESLALTIELQARIVITIPSALFYEPMLWLGSIRRLDAGGICGSSSRLVPSPVLHQEFAAAIRRLPRPMRDARSRIAILIR